MASALPRCEREDHDLDHPDGRPVAVARMTWPDGRFVPAYGCADCVVWSIRVYVLEDFEDGAQHPVLIEPVTGATAQEGGTDGTAP